MPKDTQIIIRSHRLPAALLERIQREADMTGNSDNAEINALIRDGLRFREATVILHVKEK